MLGETIECPACNGAIQLPKRQSPPTPLAEAPTQHDKPDPDIESDAATEKQIAYIRALGGTVRPGLTKENASDLIEKLRNSAPPTQKQLDLLQKLGAAIPTRLTSAQTSDLISELDGNQPPTTQQIKYIKMLGGEVPNTKREASELCDTLSKTAPATSQQKKRAEELGTVLPDNATFSQANTLLGENEMDADEEDGKPPSKAQINKIVKLGGDPSKAINNWRAEAYIEELEEKEDDFNTRVVDALEWLFGDPDSRSMMPVKKPTKAIMKKALQYGDSQGWGEGWESKDGATEFDLMPVAVYAVAPELLKENESPPRLRGQSSGGGAKGKGCLIPFILMLGACSALVFLAVAVFTSGQVEQGKDGDRANHPLLGTSLRADPER